MTRRLENRAADLAGEGELRELIGYQERIREEERSRIAREIHDELGQHLLALRLEIAMLKRTSYDSTEARIAEVDRILGHVDDTIGSVRMLINDLRPAVLDLGLVPSLEWQAHDFARATGIACHFETDVKELELDDERATVLFRVLQEALTNVVKHAKASRVDMRLCAQGESLRLEVADNGVGMPKVRNRRIKSYGLAGIRERIAMLDGQFAIETGDSGTCLVFTLPFFKQRR